MSMNVARRPAGTEATPSNGSLDEAAQALVGLLSDDPSEDQQTPDERSPEPSADATPTQQVPTAPAEEDAESPAASESAAEPDDTDPPAPSQPRTIRVTLPGGESVEVTEEEAAKGYSRTQDYTRKTQEHAAKVKAFEAERAKVQSLESQYAQVLPQLQAAIEALQPSEPDWPTVPPEQFQQRWAEWQATQKHVAQIKAERERLAQEEADRQAQETHAILRKERDALHHAIPELAKPETAKPLESKLIDYAGSLGFTPEQVQSAPDHRLFVLLHKAMQFDEQAKKAPAIQNKIDQAMAPTKPGAKPNPKPRDRLAEAKSRLAQTGSVEDGAAAIAHLLD